MDLGIVLIIAIAAYFFFRIHGPCDFLAGCKQSSLAAYM